MMPGLIIYLQHTLIQSHRSNLRNFVRTEKNHRYMYNKLKKQVFGFSSQPMCGWVEHINFYASTI